MALGTTITTIQDIMRKDLCDALEAALRRAEDTARKLADALVADLLA